MAEVEAEVDHADEVQMHKKKRTSFQLYFFNNLQSRYTAAHVIIFTVVCMSILHLKRMQCKTVHDTLPPVHKIGYNGRQNACPLLSTQLKSNKSNFSCLKMNRWNNNQMLFRVHHHVMVSSKYRNNTE